MKFTILDMKKALVALNISGLVFVLFVAFKMAVLLSEDPWLSYPNLPFVLPQTEYRAGDEVMFAVERINSDDREHVYSTSHRLVCVGRPDVLLAGSPPVSISPGRTISTSAINAIPKDTQPGTCHFAGVAEINGRMLSWTVRWRTAEFQVIT